MKFAPMHELLERALAGGYAVPSFESWNAEAIQTVLRVARKMEAPVILMNGSAGFPLLEGPGGFSRIAHALVEDHGLPVALHLDHGGSLELVRDCLKARFSSVMLDFSRKSYQENAAAMRQVVAWSHPLDVTVEGEIGAVGRADLVTTEGGGDSTLTDPQEAGRFASETGVDCLAISIGNAHGQYTKLPQFDFDRLGRIRQATKIPLVLHGGSGTPEADLKHAISLGIAKVNVATDLVRAWWDTLEAQKQAGRDLWLPIAVEEAMQNVAKQVERWIRMTGAAGQARK
jgi:fructose-bisphosphate aldolase, class II